MPTTESKRRAMRLNLLAEVEEEAQRTLILREAADTVCENRIIVGWDQHWADEKMRKAFLFFVLQSFLLEQ